MKTILLIVPYFGKWPLWFDAFLISIGKNPSIDWLCPTDCEVPKNYPSNITFLPTTLPRLNEHVNKVMEAEVPLKPRKFCDLKPAYGAIFSEQVEDYEFWGICDMDIVWGDIRKFMTKDLLANYDIISSRNHNISGHFTLFRNTEAINQIYKKLPNQKTLYESENLKRVDEEILSQYLKENQNGKSLDLKVYWPTILCNQENDRDSHQEYYLDKWLWKEGKMLELKNGKPINEVMYLHFINWKRTMKYSKINYADNPEQFYVSYCGIHYNTHNSLAKSWNSFKNVFNGYNVSESRRIKKKKIQRIIKKVNRKIFKN